MQKDKPTKSKVAKPKPKKTPKAQSVEETGKHELVVQDRIAGATIKQLMASHGYSRQMTRNIINAHKDRIDEAVAAYLEDRQEAMQAAMKANTMTLVEMITETSGLVKRTVDRLHGLLNREEAGEIELSSSFIIDCLDTATKACGKVYDIAFNQQKQAKTD